MKKRLLSLVLCLVMVFSLLPMASFAQVEPAGSTSAPVEVKFFKGSVEVANSAQRVLADGNLSEGALYDPGCPLDGQEVLLGWQINGSGATLPVDAKDGTASVRSYINEHHSSLAGETLPLNAVLGEVKYLVYMDENDRVLKSEAVLEENNAYKTTVDLDYVPTDAQKDFFGWATTKGATTANYQNDDEITLTAVKTTLYPVVKQGYWISFEENIDQDADPTKATFTAPQFYEGGATTTAPTPPTRPGYRFVGWYDDAALTTPHAFGTINADQTVYAKWVPDGTVTYRVNFWKQKTTDDPYAADADKTYDYYKMADSITIRSAHALDMVSIISADTTRDVASTGEDSYFFTYNGVNTDTGEVLVKGDGSTVLNVYYDRKPITFRFLDSDGNLFFNTIESGGASYTYDDPWATAYYMIGQPGPKGADWRPSGGETLYSFDDMRKDDLDDPDYNGSYFTDTRENGKSPNANNVYSTTNGDFTWKDGTLYHHHNYWFSGREFAQFYYYENQSGTYPVGQGPDPDRPSESGATSGTHYQYVDPFADGYYIVGGSSANVPIVYNESNPPSSDVGLYYYHDGDYESSSLTSGMGSNFPQSTTTNPNNSNAIYYPSSPKGTYHWFEGYLYDYHTDWWNDYYHALYYKYTNRSGYYEVGTGPLPTAPGTHNVNKSEYTGLYGAKFDNWITPQSRRSWVSNGSTYPLPLRQFVPKGQTTSQEFTDTSFNGSHPLTALGQDLNGSYSPGVVLGTAYCSSGYDAYWTPSETYEGFTIKQYQRNGYDSSPKTCTTTTEIDIAGDSLTLFYERHQHNFIMTSNNEDVVTDTLYYEASLNGYGTSDYVPTNGPDGAYFDGWYADPGFKTPFDFNTTMPDNDVRVYAKWTTMRFRVILDPTNGDTSIDKSTISFGNNNQVTSFRLDYGEKIEKNAVASATRTDGNKTYQLIGWYTDPEFQHPFSFDFAKWDDIADFDYAGAPAAQRQGTDFWNNNAAWNDADGEHDDVVGKVVLYAKWRQVMDEGQFLTVSYNAGDGSLSKTDENHYADHAEAIALSAPVAPAGYTFTGWQVLGADGETVVDTVSPGHTFEVKLDNANADKVVTLKAVYNKPADNVDIVWYENYEGGKTTIDSQQHNIAVNVRTPDTRPGFAFKGWARVNKPADGNYTPTENLTPWLVWDGTNYKVNGDGANVTKVWSEGDLTANQALYAVWESTYPINADVELDKDLSTPDPDTGNYSITLTANAEGRSDVQETHVSSDTDVVIVIDNSGSMDNKMSDKTTTRRAAAIAGIQSLVDSTNDENVRIAIVRGGDDSGNSATAVFNGSTSDKYSTVMAAANTDDYFKSATTANTDLFNTELNKLNENGEKQSMYLTNTFAVVGHLLQSRGDSSRPAVILFFSDGRMHFAKGSGNDAQGLQAVKTVDNIDDVSIFTVHTADSILNESDPDLYTKRMRGFSSQYPNATYGNDVDPGAAAGSVMYAQRVNTKETADFSGVINTVIHTIAAPVTLDKTAYLEDVINLNNFSVVGTQPTFTVKTQEVNAAGQNVGNPQTFTPAAGTNPTLPEGFTYDASTGVAYNAATGAVRVYGFDYSDYYINAEQPNPIHNGRRLILTIGGLQPKYVPDQISHLESNVSAGVYAADGTPAEEFDPSPFAEILSKSYVIDFSAKTKVADGAKKMLDETGVVDCFKGENGTFAKSGESVTYQLDTEALSGKNAVVNKAYSGVDKVMVFGQPVGETGTSWKEIVTIPASNIYFDDDLLRDSVSIDAGEGFGLNGDITGGTTDTDSANAARVDVDASGASVKNSYYFTFNGTGIDIYCTTDSNGGYVSAALFKLNEATNTFELVEDTTQTIRNYSANPHYNVPTISFTNVGEYGTYRVKLNALKNSYYRLDGVRVYGAMANQETVYTEHDAADHANAAFESLRTLLLNDNKTFGNEADMLNRTGILYLDSVRPEVEGGTDTPWQYDSARDVYTTNSPKNEIYLSNGQGITFTIKNYSPDQMKVFIGMSVAQGSTNVKYTYQTAGQNFKEELVSSVVDQFVEIKPAADGSVVIKNEGDGILALSKIQVSGMQSRPVIKNVTIDTVDATTLSVDETAAEEPLVVELVVNEDTLRYVSEFMTMPQMIENTDPEPTADPEPTDNPTPDPTPSIADLLRQMISDFVSNLFRSISRLFGN